MPTSCPTGVPGPPPDRFRAALVTLPGTNPDGAWRQAGGVAFSAARRFHRRT